MKKSKRIISLVLAMVMAVSTLMMKPVNVEAASKPQFVYKEQQVPFYGNKNPEENTIILDILDMPSNSKIVKLSSSDTKVLKVKTEKMDNQPCVMATIKKVGKASVTATIKSGSKTYTLKTKIIAYKYECPVASIKYGKTECAKKYNNTSWAYIKYKKNAKYKVTFKPKKGWKYAYGFFTDGKTLKDTKIKQGTTITTKSKYSVGCVCFYNEKLNRYEAVYVMFE